MRHHISSPMVRATFPTFAYLCISSRYVVRPLRLSHIVLCIVRSCQAIIWTISLSLHIFIVNPWHTTPFVNCRSSFWVLVCFGWLSLGPFQTLCLSLRHRIIFWCSSVSPHITAFFSQLGISILCLLMPLLRFLYTVLLFPYLLCS
jgi:hypothetical protein